MQYDRIIIGAGAAGLFAAANTAPGKKVLLLEKTDKIGQKLLLSGSGQCNLSHEKPMKEFLNHYGNKGKLVRPALFSFPNLALMAQLEAQGFPLSVREDGKVFPKSFSAKDFLAHLETQLKKRGVDLRRNCPVTKITPLEKGFACKTPDGAFFAPNVLVCTGGASYPRTGSDGSFFACLEALGLDITPLAPALTPIFIEDYPFASLAGIALQDISLGVSAVADQKGLTFRGDVLFTHKNLSGPVILNNSRDINPGAMISLNYLPGQEEAHLRRALLQKSAGNARQISTVLEEYTALPSRFLALLCERLEIPKEKKASQISGAEMAQVAKLLVHDQHRVEKRGDWKGAMVTQGGLAWAEINPKTMESTRYPGLYFAGEVLDVDGDTGGYNLQFAFSSAICAQKAMT